MVDVPASKVKFVTVVNVQLSVHEIVDDPKFSVLAVVPDPKNALQEYFFRLCLKCLLKTKHLHLSKYRLAMS